MSGGEPALPAALAIFGATGCGKTDLALALADRVPCHLISCDAVQVYRDLRAATAKPFAQQRRHQWALIDVQPPDRDVDAGQWVRWAEAELRWAARAGRLPVLVGGTGMYLRALTKGIAPAPPRDPVRRAALQAREATRGVAYLHRLLVRLDPQAARAIQPNDRQRLVRALEVRLGTGRSLHAWQADGWRGPDRLRLVRWGLYRPRAELYAALDARVERFFADGLIAETRWLRETLGLSAERNALRAIGYRETAAFLAGTGASSAAALVELVKRNTRRYAKRQATWFRSEPDCLWLEADDPDRLARGLASLDAAGLLAPDADRTPTYNPAP